MTYHHHWTSGLAIDLPEGKVVCVGRNYADHARELGNEVPSEPLLFMKPATALVPLEQPLKLPADRGEIHHELEIAALIGRPLKNANSEAARAAIYGIGLALDLTLRELQNELKQGGLPWEKAKAFDGSCPLSPFIETGAAGELDALELELVINGTPRQRGSSAQMLFTIPELIADISRHFSLRPGDVVLTGTPAGVGPLQDGDELAMRLGDMLRVETSVKLD